MATALVMVENIRDHVILWLEKQKGKGESSSFPPLGLPLARPPAASFKGGQGLEKS